MKVLPRHLTLRAVKALSTSRVINIIGPRQSGKTTLVRDLIETGAYITLDDDGTRDALQADPYSQLLLLSQTTSKSSKSTAIKPVAIDEVQRLPEITLALKRIVDASPNPGQFLLTGSSDIFTSGKAYDSLAGRVMTLTLRPLSSAEIFEKAPCRLLDLAGETHQKLLSTLPKAAANSRTKAIDLILRGGFPEIRKLDDRDRALRYLSYLDSIVERDVVEIASVRKPETMRRLIDQIAARTSEEISIQSLCRDLGATKETVNAYLDILSRLGIIHRLGAWTSAASMREIKAPKIHFLDTGCATALRAEDSGSFGIGASPEALGHLLESFVFIELEKSLPFLAKRWRLYHWRQDNREIDIVAEAPGKQLTLFEIKAASTVSESDFRHINWFLKEGPGKSYKGTGFVVYLGQEILSFGQGRVAIPLSLFWSFTE